MPIIAPEKVGKLQYHSYISGRDEETVSAFWVPMKPEEREADNSWHAKTRKGNRLNKTQGLPESRNVSPNPLDQILFIAPEELRQSGPNIVAWLERQPSRNRNLLLRRLAKQLRRGIEESKQLNCNVFAAAQLLSRYNSPNLIEVITAGLNIRPLVKEHTLLVSMLRALSSTIDPVASAHLTSIVSDLTMSADESAMDRWKCRLLVESMRTLAHVAPEEMLKIFPIAIQKAGDLEITALLDDTVTAASSTTTEFAQSSIADVIDELWARFRDSRDFYSSLNGAGVCARLLELKGYLGQTASEVLEMTNNVPSKTDVLYILAQRPLKCFKSPDREAILRCTISTLRTGRKRMSLHKILGVAIADKELDIFNILCGDQIPCP